jgi:dipeptidyl-peptidase-3
MVDIISVISEREKKYTHYLGLASWAGARIIQGIISLWSFIYHIDIRTSAGQWTPQAQDLYDLLVLMFIDDSGQGLADLDALQKSSGLSATEWGDLLQYTIQACWIYKRDKL